ncbi:MAG: hypothetical protein GC157_15690 [Frankiales bacterium]|nr:hypothetical protein [Frankiales bacterium]
MTQPTPPDGSGNGPSFVPPLSEPGAVPPAPASSSYSGPSMPDIADIVEGSKGRPEPRGGLGRNVLVGAVVGAVVIAGGAFFAGRAMAAGPATLADAFAEAQAGTLPCGTSASGPGQFLSRLCGGAGGAGGFTPGGGAGQAGGTGAGAGQGDGGGFGGFGRGLAGTVTAVTPSSVTVDTRAGSVTVAVPGTATVSKTVDGKLSDVAVGSTVTIASTTDANGNRVASRITIVPAGQLPGGPGNGPA